MKLVVKHRFSQKKSEVKQIRSVGDIPAVIYSLKKETVHLIVSGQEFDIVLRQVQSDHLSTTIFTLSDGVKEYQAIIKDIEYHVITYKVLHIDFQELIDNVNVHIKVPVNHIGTMECIGVKLGGVIRQVMRKVKVKCQPKHIPTKFDVDVKDANIGNSLRVKDLQGVSSDVTVLAKDHDVVAVIAKR